MLSIKINAVEVRRTVKNYKNNVFKSLNRLENIYSKSQYV